MGSHTDHYPSPRQFSVLFKILLGPEASYYRVILVYSVAISLLTLAIPISVQLLIDTIANIGRIGAVVSIGLLMFTLLLLSGVLQALRAWSMELFKRRIYARLTGEIALTAMLAEPGHFAKAEEAALINRYFDIMTLKKNIPYLLSYGFTLLFQTVIGFVVVSLYHFYFFVFCLVFLLLVYLTWVSFGWKAISSGFAVSESKHRAAAWLQQMASSDACGGGGQQQNFALERTNALVHEHIDAEQAHFRFSFAQLLCYLFIYALASAALLGMGGWLVIQGQMTLGQLVAAELILSSIFYGLPQLAGYLDYYYDVCAAVEELARFRHAPVTPA
jgi:ABC-type bacteriocin/lantibiotic exporter with double-glycine peptidase domain